MTRIDTFSFKYQVFSSRDEMEREDVELIEAAKRARKNSYAPYSSFNVGAAVRLDDGTIVTGSNQENRAFPSGTCAERTALFAASSSWPDKAITSIAIVGGHKGSITESPVTPCGACRQVMVEMESKGGHKISVILAGENKALKFDSARDLLPFVFDAEL